MEKQLDPIKLPSVRGLEAAGNLTALLSSFDGHDDRMVEGTRARLRKDKTKIEEMEKETERLTQALATQVEARRNMNQKLQMLCEARLKMGYATFDALLADRTTRVEERLDALDDRITALSELFDIEKARIQAEISERQAELMEMLSKFRELFETECAERAEREAAIKREMEDHDRNVEERIQVEAEARETVIAQLRTELSENIESRLTADKQFAAFVGAELARVKANLSEECKARELEDNEIETSLFHYTSRLQKSLHAVNSTD